MTPEADGADAGAWHALANQALLHHLHHGDSHQALHLLLAGLTRRLGCTCRLQALDADGAVRWQIDASAGIDRDAAFASAGPPLALPLRRLGRSVGLLHITHPPLGDGTTLPRRLEPVRAAFAALLLQHDIGGEARRTSYMEMIRGALQGAGTFVWEWDIDSDWLSDSDDSLAQLGYDAQQVGRTQLDWDRLIHPDDVDANHAAYLRHARGETEHYEHAYRIRTHDGRWRWYQERGRIVERHADGRPRRMLGTQTDITEQREHEQAALQAAARLERIAQHVPGVLYQFELDAQFVPRFSYISERGRTLLGLDPARASVDAAELIERIEPEDREAVAASIIESAHRLSLWRWEFRLRMPDGTQRWILGTSSPTRGARGAMVWHGYMQDVTELRELERARQDKAAAEAANRAKTEFLSRMSHELRTPLNAVLGFSQLLEIDRADPLSDGQRRRVRLIRESGEHLLQMIGDLLDLTRIESGSMQVQIDAVPLRAVAEEAIQMLRPAADAANVAVSLQLDAEGLAARADRTRLRQVLLNLLSNAIKYNRAGGRVELHATAAPPAGAQAWLSIRVSDTGVGIAAEDMPHLFEPFNRLSQARGGVEGTGIGLSLTRALVTLMHGRIQAESRLGEGSVFSVLLPRA